MQSKTVNTLFSIYIPKDKIIKYTKEDLTIKEISELLQVSPATIRKRLSVYGLSIPRKHIRYKLNVPFTELVKEYNSGISIPEIAKKYKVSPTYIKIRIRENGGVIRSKKQAQLIRYQRERMEINM